MTFTRVQEIAILFINFLEHDNGSFTITVRSDKYEVDLTFALPEAYPESQIPVVHFFSENSDFLKSKVLDHIQEKVQQFCIVLLFLLGTIVARLGYDIFLDYGCCMLYHVVILF